MPSILTVNNNVSLISITVAPSTWLATVTLFLAFLALYIPRLTAHIPRIRLPSLPSLPSLPPSLQPRGYIERQLPSPHRHYHQQSLLLASGASPSSVSNSKDGRPSRRPRRLFAGFRTSSKSNISTSLVSSPQRASNGGSRGLGYRFRRWVFAAGVAETRQRRSEQRLLEAPQP